MTMTWGELSGMIDSLPDGVRDQDVQVYDYECGVSALADDVEPFDLESGEGPWYLTVSRWFS